jgi:hypothetical protein
MGLLDRLFASTPDVGRLKANRNLRGLLKATRYDKRDSATGGYSREAVQIHTEALKALLEVVNANDVDLVDPLIVDLGSGGLIGGTAQLLGKIGGDKAFNALTATLLRTDGMDQGTVTG